MMPDPIRNIPRRRAPVLGRSQPESPRGSGTFQRPGSFRRCRGRGRPHSGNSEIGPRISGRVQEAFRTGEIRKKIDPAKKRFTPCTLFNSLLEAITEAAKNAAIGDVVLLSPACSSFDQFQNYQQSGEGFYHVMKSISRGRHNANPNRNGRNDGKLKRIRFISGKCNFSFRGFLRKNHGANHPPTHTSQKGRCSAKPNE